MMGRLRSSRANEFDVGEFCERIIKGLRKEINGVVREIEKNKSMTVEGMKGLLKDSLEAVVSSVEKVMTGASDELAGERKRREEEKRSREEKIRIEEERVGKERKRKEQEERRMEERMRKLEQKEKEREEWERKEAERIDKVEELIKKEKEERLKEVRRVEAGLEKGEKERERVERELNDLREEAEDREEYAADREAGRQRVLTCKESERKMEEKVGAAMERIKILDLDFGRVMESRDEIVKVAQELIRENVKLSERKEFDWSMRRNRIYVLGKATKQKEYEGTAIFTVPILIRCQCVSDKVRLERMIRNTGIRTSFHWPAEMMEFVRGVRERVEGMGHGGQEEFVRVRAVKEDGGLYIRVDGRKKEGGSFKWIGDWLCPPQNTEFWDGGVDLWTPYRRHAEVGNRN